jgi:hypothetical protein
LGLPDAQPLGARTAHQGLHDFHAQLVHHDEHAVRGPLDLAGADLLAGLDIVDVCRESYVLAQRHGAPCHHVLGARATGHVPSRRQVGIAVLGNGFLPPSHDRAAADRPIAAHVVEARREHVHHALAPDLEAFPANGERDDRDALTGLGRHGRGGREALSTVLDDDVEAGEAEEKGKR